ncbi:MAG: hypothetical protein GY875_00995 [Gammaproteobacteria bacterium]|nr:hypothetical protein [Gammaproteobacteria bacterium]
MLVQILLTVVAVVVVICVSGILQVLARDQAWMRLSAANRWAILDSLSYRVQHAKAGAITSAGILVLWICSLVVPLYISLGDEGRSNIDFAVSVLMNDAYEAPSLEELEANYADASGYDEKLQALSVLLVQASYDTPEPGEIFATVDTETDDYQWYTLALNLREPQADLSALHDERGFSFIAKRWYSKMKSTLGATRLASPNEKLEAVEAYN